MCDVMVSTIAQNKQWLPCQCVEVVTHMAGLSLHSDDTGNMQRCHEGIRVLQFTQSQRRVSFSSDHRTDGRCKLLADQHADSSNCSPLPWRVASVCTADCRLQRCSLSLHLPPSFESRV